MKRRKKNINFGFLPAHPTRADLMKSRREFKAAVRRKTKETRDEYTRLRTAARSAKPAPGVGGKKKLEQLFHEVYGQNPRQLPEFTPKQMAAIQKLIRGRTMMAKKRKSKKKRNGKMPAGLKAYWAKKRRAKNSRSKPRKKNRRRRMNPRVRTRTRTIIKYRYRTRKVKRVRRRKSNPRRHTVRRIIAPKGLSPKGLQQFRRTVAKLTGKRTRIVPR